MTLQETAFADLYALGWSDPVEIYSTIWSTYAKTLAPVKLKEAASDLKKRADIVKRVREVKDMIRSAGAKSNSQSSLDPDSVSKEAIIKGMMEDLERTDSGKDKTAIREKIAALQGYKKDEAIGKDDPTRIYAPARCEGCNLFMEARDKGVITMEDMDNV